MRAPALSETADARQHLPAQRESMRRRGQRRRLAVAIASGSLMLTPLAAPASAVSSAHCTKLEAPAPVRVAGVPTRRSSVTGCTPLAATGGSGSSVTNLNTLVSKTTWAGGKGTTIVKVTYKAGPKPNKCPKGTHLTISGGTVIGGSGAALKVIKVGYSVSARWCVEREVGRQTRAGLGVHTQRWRGDTDHDGRDDHFNQRGHDHHPANDSSADRPRPRPRRHQLLPRRRARRPRPRRFPPEAIRRHRCHCRPACQSARQVPVVQ